MRLLDYIAGEHDWPRTLEALDSELPEYRGVWTHVDALIAAGEDRSEEEQLREELADREDELREVRDRLERLVSLLDVAEKMDNPEPVIGDLAREAREILQWRPV